MHHGLDLGACCFGEHPTGVRRLKVLIEALPADAAVWAAVNGDQWTAVDEMGATTVELLADASQTLRVLANQQIPKGKPRYKPEMPFRWPRPGTEPVEAASPLSRAAVRSMFQLA